MGKSTERDRSTESMGGIFLETSQDGLTAFSGGGQASGTQIVTQTARFTTVAAAGDSAVLPSSKYGMTVTVINSGAKPMQLYGFGTDTINDVAAATGVAIMPSSMVIFECPIGGKWYAEGIGQGFSASYSTFSVKDAITAHSGGTQAGALGDANAQLPAMYNRVTVVAVGGDSVVLPVAVPGMEITVTNATAATSMNIFPNTGDAINAIAANGAYALAGTKTVTFMCSVALQWHTLLSA